MPTVARPKPVDTGIKKYRLLSNVGGHREGLGDDALDYKSGEVVSSTRDLIKAFPEKFELASARGAAEENVTADYPAASENDLVVLLRDSRYYVCGEDGAGSEFSGALKRKKVNDFINTYLDQLAEEDDADPDDEDIDTDDDDAVDDGTDDED